MADAASCFRRGSCPGFQVTANGTRPLSYQWFQDATPLVGANSFALTLANAQTNQSGAYRVVITNSAGSVTSVVATLVVRPVADLIVTDLVHPADALAGAGDDGSYAPASLLFAASASTSDGSICE